MHSLEHDTFNKMLAMMGYQKEAEGGQALAQKFIAGGRKSASRSAADVIRSALMSYVAQVSSGMQ